MRKEYEEYKPTGIEWIPQIPSHWNWSFLSQVASEQKKKKPKEKMFPVMSLSYGQIIRKKNIDVGLVPASYDNYQLISDGNIILRFTDLQNDHTSLRTGLVKEAGIITSAYTNIQPKINSVFLSYLLHSYDTMKIFYGLGGGVRQSIGFKDVRYLQLPVPPRNEQDQIVRFLDWKVSSINKLINIKHEQLNIVKELLNRVFRDISLEHSKRVKIKYLFGLENDFFVPDASELYAKAGMYNRGRGIFLREQCPGNELGDSQFQHIHPNCLMLSGQFAWEDAVYITQEKDTFGIASHRYYLLKPIKDISVEYLWAYFLSCEGFFTLQRCSHGSAGRNRPLNIKEVLDLELPVPDDLGAVKTLNKLVRDYMRLQVITGKARTNLIDLRTHLIADAVTGKIDVRNITVPEYEYVDDAADESSEDESDENDDFIGVEE